MPTTFANTINGNEILAKRAECDYAGNDLQTTYATKSELPSASQLVPASTSADASKVLTVDSQGIPGWAAGGSGGGGNVFMATSTTTFPELWQAFHEDGKIVYCTAGSASALITPYFLQTLKAYDSGHTTGTATFVQFNRYSTGRIEVYHSTVTFSSNRPTLGTVTFTRQTILPDNPSSHAGEFLSAHSSGDMVFASISQVPASTSADENKVLTVNSSGNAEWATPSGGGSVTDVEVNGTSVVNASGVAEVTVPAQVNADWNSSSGASEILNKPTIPSGAQLVPAATSADADKVLTVDSQGTPAWSTPAAGGVTDVEVDGTSVVSGGVASITMPTVDQTYNSASTDAQSGVAVAGALSTKQDTISDLATIRSGAADGATAVQPGDLATVATSGSYNDLSNTPTILPYKPVVAGTGVRIVDDTANNRIVVEADETVLWESTAGMQLDSAVSATLSEPTTNFDRVMWYHGNAGGWCVVNTYPGSATRCELVRDSYDGATYVIRDGQDMTSTDNVTFTTTLGIRRLQFNTDGSFTLSTSQSTVFKLYKVVGVNRIASN